MVYGGNVKQIKARRRRQRVAERREILMQRHQLSWADAQKISEMFEELCEQHQQEMLGGTVT